VTSVDLVLQDREVDPGRPFGPAVFRAPGLLRPRAATWKAGDRMRLLLVAVTALLFVFGCASHSDKTRPIRSALDAGNPKMALGLLNERLDVDSEKELPEKTSGDNALLLLDRAMVLQALSQYALSSRDLEVSDKQIEVLDLSRNAAHEIGKYLFSDDVGPYKAPPYEKLMINTMNMVNYLARSDLQGARVEARRLTVMQKYLTDSEGGARGLIGLGSYLAGFTYEKSGKADEALRYYDEALAYGDYPSLAAPIRRLSASSGYRSPRLTKILEQTPAESGSEDDAEVLVIIGSGRVPPKIARRIPIGLALTYASGALSPTDHAQANRLALQGLVSWVNFPELGRPTGQYVAPRLLVDQRSEPLEGALNVTAEARRAWDEARGAVVAGAITRLIARIVAGEALRRSTKNEGIGLLLSLGAQATLTAVDTPDTRSWETLPAHFSVARVRLSPEKHELRIQAGRASGVRSVKLRPKGWALVSLTSLAGG
jgi:tetratricopeptide (TPR) repeat protein